MKFNQGKFKITHFYVLKFLNYDLGPLTQDFSYLPKPNQKKWGFQPKIIDCQIKFDLEIGF